MNTLTVEMRSGTLEARIISILLTTYPVTVEDLMREMHISRERILYTLEGLASRGFLVLEPLPGKTYIRLLRMDFRFIGRNETQRKAVKRGKGRGKRKNRGRKNRRGKGTHKER